jgi:hypothetical protein
MNGALISGTYRHQRPPSVLFLDLSKRHLGRGLVFPSLLILDPVAGLTQPLNFNERVIRMMSIELRFFPAPLTATRWVGIAPQRHRSNIDAISMEHSLLLGLSL